ncbi:nuclear transport factor 2 family protein [Paraburkholderia pallida]|nr:nuclear transport factor 2 family protein [Paraburkholderia pallida]
MNSLSKLPPLVQLYSINILPTNQTIQHLELIRSTTPKVEVIEMSLPVEEIEEIRQRKAQYCRYLDTKKFDEWENLFIPDASVTFYNVDGSPQYHFSSIAELSSVTRNGFASAQTIHQLHNSEIELKSDTEAHAIWSMEDLQIFPAEGRNPTNTVHGYGFYHDTWKLIDGEWKLAVMELRRIVLDVRQS